MNELDQIDAAIAALQAKREEWLSQQSWPKPGDLYYAIGTFGDVHKFAWNGDSHDVHALKMGNVFKTAEDAHTAIAHRITVTALANSPGRIAFKHDTTEKWCFDLQPPYTASNLCIVTRCTAMIGLFNIFFGTEADILAARDAIGAEAIAKAALYQGFHYHNRIPTP